MEFSGLNINRILHCEKSNIKKNAEIKTKIEIIYFFILLVAI